MSTFLEGRSSTFKIWVSIGLAGVLAASYFLYTYNHHHPDANKIKQLQRLITQSFPTAQPNLCPLTHEKTKTMQDQYVSMDVTYISQLENKTKTTLSSTRNPFLPPFEKGIMITQLPPKHRLLYNKFYFYRNHLLVVTEQFEEQTERLSLQDLKQALFVSQALKGVFFYNSGPQSGFSQKHKHIQILPSQSLKLPILHHLLHSIKSQTLQPVPSLSPSTPSLSPTPSASATQKIHLYKGYPFIHGIICLPKSKSLSQCACAMKTAYDTLHGYLGKILRNCQFSYNIIANQEFLLIIPRKKEKTVGDVGVNAICFMGSMLVKDQKLFNQIDKMIKPSTILRDLTFTDIPHSSI